MRLSDSQVVSEILAGNRRALARFLSQVENDRNVVTESLSALYPHSAQSWIIGVTGAPGTGKSSLVTLLAKALREQDKTLAIVAVDPTSPFSGGAILGDRIRMRDLAGDKGVYIRSMATRGSLGGLARATRDVVRVLASAGFEYIIVETVGAGQSEVDIARTAHTTLVIEAPGLGDDVQAIKAGILETGDILVVNKSDLSGADRTYRALKSMLELGHPTKHHPDANIPMWIPPIIKTSTKTPAGIPELIEQIQAHQRYIEAYRLKDTLIEQAISVEFNDRLQNSLLNHALQTFGDEVIAGIIRDIASYKIDPQLAVDQLLAGISLTLNKQAESEDNL